MLNRLIRLFVCLTGLMAATALQAADATPAKDAPAASGSSRFRDPEDGWFDMSNFLDTVYGFVPVLMPITEPAVGYGAVGALVFIDRKVPGQDQRYTRPNIAVLGGLGTENGTRGLFALHLGTWLDGSLRTIAGVADMDVNLDFFGLGGDRAQPGASLGYNVEARGGLIGANYRIGESPWWIGLRYQAAKTDVTLDAPNPGLPGIGAQDLGLTLAALAPSITLDMRDNFFTPTEGWYVDLSTQFFREAFGGDRDFERTTLMAMYYHPVGRSLFLSVRGAAKTSSSQTPFFLRPFVSLRGVEALRYQGDEAAEAEAELRWQFHSRFSLVGFAGAGAARVGGADDSDKTVTAGGVGFRYMIARKHGLHMGLDVAVGPDNPILYVVFGNAWLRP